MEAEYTVPKNWTTSEKAPRGSGFEIASMDEDVVENAPTREEYIQLRDFIQQEADHRSAAPDWRTTCTAAIYRPTMPHEIRVLRLAPGRYQQPWFQGLATLHYVWRFSPQENQSSIHRHQLLLGIDDSVCPITVSGHDKTITRTLDEILRHLRSGNETVTVWVDQLCIDQTNDTDKESQVKLMNAVYTRARNTIIWLGKEAGGEAFNALRKLARDTAGSSLEMAGETLDALRRPSGINAGYAQGMKDLRVLLLQPWFQRTWVIQEAVLSSDVYLMAGHDTISWQDFAGDCAAIDEYGIFDDEVGTQANRIDGRKSGLGAATTIFQRKADFGSGSSSSMTNWLVETRYAYATKPLDKIYGILGVCESDIQPNYSKPVEELFTEIAARELRDRIQAVDPRRHTAANYIARFLCCVDHDTDPAENKLPSWVPDWSKPRLTTSLVYTTACVSYYPSGDAMGRRTFFLSDTDQTLFITAEPAGRVAHLSDTFTDAEILLDDSPTSNVSLRHCIAFYNQPHLQGHFDELALWKTFCSTLVAGKDHTGFQKCREDYIETLSFLCDLASARSPTFAGQTYTARQKKPIGRGGLTVNHFTKGQSGRTFQSLKGAYRNALLNRKLCWTDNGLLALVPRYTRPADTIFRFLGCCVPFVLRRVEEDKFILVGECYALSLMDGSTGKHPTEYGTVRVI